MKKTVLLFALITGWITFAAMAQNETNGRQFRNRQSIKKTPEQEATILSDTMNRICSMSNDQYQAIYAMNVNFFIQKDSLRSALRQTGDRDAYKQQMQQLSQQRKQELASVLSAGQQTAWQNWKKEQKESMSQKKELYQQNHPKSGNHPDPDKTQSPGVEQPPASDMNIFGE